MDEEIINKGVTEDYIWHEAKSMLAKMKSLQCQFEELVFTMSRRDKDNRTVIAKLYAENFQMTQEIKDLKEKQKEEANLYAKNHQLTQENYLLKSQVETLMEEWRKNNGPAT